MTDDEILEKIETIVRDELDDDDIVLSLTTKAMDVAGWDSLAHITIMVSIERAFGVQFATSDITTLGNIGDLVRLVRTTRAAD